MMRAFLSSALFCVLILALLPISPVKSSFDGTFSFKGMFYTYNGQQSPTVNPNGDDPIFGDEDEDDEEDAEDDSTMYEVTCPNCGQISTLDEETLMDPEGDLVCPHCGATFDIELEGTEDDSAEETDKQDH